MYLRFVRATKIDGSGSRAGFFVAAYELRDRLDLDPHARAQLEDLLAWYRKHLPIPSRFTTSKSKGSYRGTNAKAISWFKPTATEHLAKAFELTALLSQHGYPIDILKSGIPGYVTYEDAYQLVAEPFSDTRVD